MAEFLTETMIAMRLVWLRVTMYFLIPFLTVCLAQTETWSGDTWDTTHWFLKVRIVAIATIAGFIPFVSYIDQSLSRAREEVLKRRAAKTGDTDFIEKPKA